MASPWPAHAIMVEHFRHSAIRAERIVSTTRTLAAWDARLALESCRGPARRPALARRRSRRRHDAAREAALEARSRARSIALAAPAPARRRARLRHERQDHDGGHGELDPRRRAYRLAWNNSGANLASGVTSTLLAADGAELGLLEVDEFALPEVMRRTRPACRLPRQPLPRPARPLRRARAHRRALARRGRGAPARDDARRRTPTTRSSPTLAGGPRARSCFGVDDPRRARRRCSTPPTRSTASAAARRTAYDAAYVGHLGATAASRAATPGRALDVAAREIEPRRPRRCLLRAARAGRRARASGSRLPGLYNVYNALAAASLALSLGVALDDVAAGLERFSAAFGRFERFAVRDRRVLLVLIKNPAGANEAIRTLDDGGVPPTLVVALNDAIADGRDVSWIWDVDFEPLLERADRIVVSGERAAELALRFTYGGFPRERLEVVPGLEDALDRGLELRPPGGELAVLPTYTAMLALRAIATDTRPRRARTGRTTTREPPRRAPLPGVPQHLRRPRQHRRARRAGRRYAATSSSVEPVDARDGARVRARTTSSTSAAGRIASRR